MLAMSGYKESRVDIDIFYPTINNNKIWETCNIEGPILKIVQISGDSVILVSKVPLQSQDFIAFLFKVGSYPFIDCLVGVDTVVEKCGQYVASCKFYLLSDEHKQMICSFVEESNSGAIAEP